MGKVVVLGAGPAGLAAAWKLSRGGWDVEVLEAQDYVGGLAHTMRHEDYLFDFGPHRFHSANSAVLDEITDLMGPMPTRDCKTQVYFGASSTPTRSRPEICSRASRRGWRITCFTDFFATWVKNKIHPAEDTSFKAWVVNRFGQTPLRRVLWAVHREGLGARPRASWRQAGLPSASPWSTCGISCSGC